MKSKELCDLNFNKLLNYGGMPAVQSHYEKEIYCKGYCIECEKAGINTGGNKGQILDQMSHGADTWDFEQLLGELDKPYNEIRVTFLLESPGGYYKNGKPIFYNSYKKQPPVNHYYWLPNLKEWPKGQENFEEMYGSYFAYLIKIFCLKNAYFTNIVKCSLGNPSENKFIPYEMQNTRHMQILDKCHSHFLLEELKIHNPSIIYCFGGKAMKMAKHLALESELVELYHPAARLPRKTIIGKNNEIIASSLTARKELII